MKRILVQREKSSLLPLLPLLMFVLPSFVFADQREPNPDLTPGHATYHTSTTVCKIKTSDERYVPDSVKKEVYERYGIEKCSGYCDGPQGCEVDHLISLELGGANTIDNLWPQPYDGEWNAWDKDRLETRMHALICAKHPTLTLKDAQEEIRTDWKAAYKKYVGELRPHKHVNHCQ